MPHKKYLNDYLTGKWPGSLARGELYNDDPTLGDARLCGTTASLCGVETALAKGDKAALDRALTLDIALHALMFTLSGVPVLYSGDEVAQCNDERYHDDPLKAEDSRYLHRGDMDWQAAERRGNAKTPEGRVFAAVKKLETLRARHAVFDTAARVSLLPERSNSLLGIRREMDGKRLIALFNFSDQAQPALPDMDGSFTNLWTGRRVRAEGLSVPAGGFLWLAD